MNLEKLAGQLGTDLVRDVTAVNIPCDRPPWVDTGLVLEEGDCVTGFGSGQTTLVGTEIAVGPAFQLWYRVGDGEIFRGTRDTHTFTADRAGPLQVASYFPGEWGTRTGALGVPEGVYAMAAGALSVVLVRWAGEPLAGLQAMVALGDESGLVAGEIDRLADPGLPPEGWYYKWFIGPAEIFRPAAEAGRRNAISCRTKADCGLLLRDVAFPLEPGTKLRWSWKTDALPSSVPENTFPQHDYMSIAVEMDNGQDITYFWSSSLAPESAFRCPIPLWNMRETHVAVRSGTDGLGEWCSEERDLYADYVNFVGGVAGAGIVRVWLIGLSLFQHQEGRSTFADIMLVSPSGKTVEL